MSRVSSSPETTRLGHRRGGDGVFGIFVGHVGGNWKAMLLTVGPDDKPLPQTIGREELLAHLNRIVDLLDA